MTPRQHFIDYAARRILGGEKTTSTDLAEVLDYSKAAAWGVMDGTAPTEDAYREAVDALDWTRLARAVDRARGL